MSQSEVPSLQLLSVFLLSDCSVPNLITDMLRSDMREFGVLEGAVLFCYYGEVVEPRELHTADVVEADNLRCSSFCASVCEVV